MNGDDITDLLDAIIDSCVTTAALMNRGQQFKNPTAPAWAAMADALKEARSEIERLRERVATMTERAVFSEAYIRPTEQRLDEAVRLLWESLGAFGGKPGTREIGLAVCKFLKEFPSSERASDQTAICRAPACDCADGHCCARPTETVAGVAE